MPTKKKRTVRIGITPNEDLATQTTEETLDLLKKLSRHESDGLASRIKTLRMCEDYTQAELAEMLGVSKSHLGDIENRRKFLSPERAAKFAKKLGYPEHYFIQLALQDVLNAGGFKYSVRVAKIGANYSKAS